MSKPGCCVCNKPTSGYRCWLPCYLRLLSAVRTWAFTVIHPSPGITAKLTPWELVASNLWEGLPHLVEDAGYEEFEEARKFRAT